ncbi:hypothetical protein NE865_08359 [Phthorimaea operculella]|nr:hypothetical protein NE865_08359 [Phthorimaea operculella]
MAYNYSRRHISQEQQQVMVEFLEKHPDLVCGRAKANGKMLWHVLAKKLNVVEGGVRRPSRLWAKTWFDKKSTLKRLLLKQTMERRRGLAVSHVKWTPLDTRIINMLIQTGELNTEDIDMDLMETAISAAKSFTKTEKLEIDHESLPSHASSPTLPDEDNGNEIFENIEYLEAGDCAPANMEVKLPKKSKNHSRDTNVDPLHAEWSRVASMEEQRIEIDQQSCKARQDTSDALQRCALAIEALAGAVNYQGSVISEALRAQGDSIAEALKAQGKMIADALANR